MIGLVEGAKRQRTPNEIALSILLAAADDCLPAGLRYAAALQHLCNESSGREPSDHDHRAGGSPDLPDSHDNRRGCSALSASLHGSSAEGTASSPPAAGPSKRRADVDVLLLDKTGTITLGNRQAVALMPAPGVTPEGLADAAQLASLADETPKAAVSWCSQTSSSTCASATSRRWTRASCLSAPVRA